MWVFKEEELFFALAKSQILEVLNQEPELYPAIQKHRVVPNLTFTGAAFNGSDSLRLALLGLIWEPSDLSVILIDC